MKKEKEKHHYFLKFWDYKTKEELLKLIKQCSYSFFTVAAILALIGILLEPLMIIDAIIFAILALLLLTLKSRVVSIIILIISLLSLLGTIINTINQTGVGSNLFLAILIVYVAIETVYATFKYNK